MAEEVIHFFLNNNINLQYCGGQTFDNANNMTGIYEGLQAQIKKKCNVALFAPCFAHFLNLVGTHTVKCCLEAIFFLVFSSTHRWNFLLTGLQSEEKNKIIVLKTLSYTSWKCHMDSCNAIILKL